MDSLSRRAENSAEFSHNSSGAAAGRGSTLTPSRRVTILRSPSLWQARLAGSLSELVRYRDLLYTLSLHRIKVRYKQSVLGIFWAVLQPLSLMLIYTVVFSVIVKMPSEGAPYALFAYVAILPWSYCSTSIGGATNSLVSHTQLITKVYFPREILPLSYIIAALCDFLIASVLLFVMLIYYKVQLTYYALYAVPIIFLLTLLLLAIALLFSATQVRFRDVGVAIPLLLQLWMFATPVVYPLSAVPAHIRPLYVLNPMVGLIENFRRVILQASAPDFYTLSISAVEVLILLVPSYIYFKRVEATMADII